MLRETCSQVLNLGPGATYLVEKQQPELLIQPGALRGPGSQAPRNGQRPRRPHPELCQVLLHTHRRGRHITAPLRGSIDFMRRPSGAHRECSCILEHVLQAMHPQDQCDTRQATGSVPMQIVKVKHPWG